MTTFRKFPIVTGQVYHVLNRSVAKQPIFVHDSSYLRALEIISYYQYLDTHVRFSHYIRLPEKLRNSTLDALMQSKKRVKILAFCIMPNHMHFLLQETSDKGISTFMSNIQNSYAKWFNIKNKRNGALFQQMFKAVLIENDEQLIHVVRYIHLNPVTSFVVKDIKELLTYPWTSFPDYINKEKSKVIDRELILGLFPSTEKFIEFIQDQTDYQRQLNKIKHLILE